MILQLILIINLTFINHFSKASDPGYKLQLPKILSIFGNVIAVDRGCFSFVTPAMPSGNPTILGPRLGQKHIQVNTMIAQAQETYAQRQA